MFTALINPQTTGALHPPLSNVCKDSVIPCNLHAGNYTLTVAMQYFLLCHSGDTGCQLMKQQVVYLIEIKDCGMYIYVAMETAGVEQTVCVHACQD